MFTTDIHSVNKRTHTTHCTARMKKKLLRETQTLRTGCSKAEPKISLPQLPFPGARDGQNLISWRRSLPSPANPVWWGSMHAISSYRGNRPINTHTHRQGWLQYTVPLSLAHSVNITKLHTCVVKQQCVPLKTSARFSSITWSVSEWVSRV